MDTAFARTTIFGLTFGMLFICLLDALGVFQ